MKIGVEKYCEGIPPAKVRRKSPSTTIVHVLAWKLHLKRWIVEEAHSCSHGRMEERLKEEGESSQSFPWKNGGRDATKIRQASRVKIRHK